MVTQAPITPTDNVQPEANVVNFVQTLPVQPLPSSVTTTASSNGTTTMVASKLRIVCIAGFAETSRAMALKLPPEVEIWSLNRCYTFLKRWDRWYEVHQPELYTGKTGLREPQYLELLRASKVPIYMQVPDPTVPKAVLFPKAEIVASGLRDYFTTSIAYMIAHAIYEHDQGQRIGEIHLYGVDMSAYSEYSFQRPCVEYWLGVADGRGIKVIIPRQSPVLKGSVYGNHSYQYLWEQVKDRIVNLKDIGSQQVANLQAVMGAQTELNRTMALLPEIPTPTPEQPLKLELVHELLNKVRDAKITLKSRMNELGSAQSQMTADVNANQGSLREAQHWLTVVNAPQSEKEEPNSAKLPRI